MKPIHILLSKKGFEELRDLKKKLKLDEYVVEFDCNNLPETYEEYLKQEESNPTIGYLG